MFINIIKTAAMVSVLSALSSTASIASSIAINFDNVNSGASATSSAPAGISFLEAEFATDVDQYGDEIPGSERWRSVLNADTIVVNNPLDSGFNAAPSGPNALDARFAPVLMHFESGIDLANFSLTTITFDNQTFGGLLSASLLFLNSQGGILGQVDSQNTPALSFPSLNSTIAGVSSILLPSGAFYDNITVTPVPLPTTIWFFGSSLVSLFCLSRRRNKRFS